MEKNKKEISQEDKQLLAILADNLDDIMIEKGTNSEQLSRKSKMSKSTISGYKNTNHFPKISSIVKIAKTLNVSIDYLLGLSESESISLEDKSITERLGLSSKSIEILEELNKSGKYLISTINYLIEQEMSVLLENHMEQTTQDLYNKAKNITDENQKNVFEERIEKKYKKMQDSISQKNFTPIISKIDNYFNINHKTQEMFITPVSVEYEKDIPKKFKKVYKNFQKIDVTEKIIDEVFLKDITKEIKNAKTNIKKEKR